MATTVATTPKKVTFYTHPAVKTEARHIDIKIPHIQPQIKAVDFKTGEDITDKVDKREIQAYVDYVNDKLDKEHAEKQKADPNYTAPRMPLKSLIIKFDGDFVDLEWEVLSIPIQRIRRITGYLVGTLDRFNNGKRAEEHDRVKHGIEDPAVHIPVVGDYGTALTDAS